MNPEPVVDIKKSRPSTPKNPVNFYSVLPNSKYSRPLYQVGQKTH